MEDNIKNNTNMYVNPVNISENHTYDFLKELSENSIISGKKIQDITSIYLGIPQDFECNSIIDKDISKQININTINNIYNNPLIIFCYAERLMILKEKLIYFKNPFILITHNSNEKIDEKYETILFSNKVIKWYAQNILINHPKLFLIPNGIDDNRICEYGSISVLKNIMNNINNKSNDIYFLFTDSLNNEEIKKENPLLKLSDTFEEYLRELSKYKFAVFPDNTEMDSHRIWECYYLGVIPIVIKNRFTEQLSKYLPCVLVEKIYDFNEDILEKYDAYIKELKDNINYLKLDYYIKEIEQTPIKIVWFYEEGRTGNNIFQYLGAEIIKYIYNFDIIKRTTIIDNNLYLIDDNKYTEITKNFMANNKKLEENRNILIRAYCQKSDILLYLRPYLIKYFNEINHTILNSNYKISDLYNHISSYNMDVSNDDLVLHLRLDDFIHNNNPPNIFSKSELADYLDTIPFKKLYIVCDKIRYEWEKNYIDFFKNRYDVVMVSGSMLDDFTFIKNAKRAVISQSTLSWIAAYFGNGEIYVPYSNFYKDHQILKECHDRCYVHYGLNFAKDLK
jgi:hypothetical protein